jgi:hypothetical protein
MGSTILANGEPSLLISLKAIVTDWLSIADRPTHVRGRNHAV